MKILIDLPDELYDTLRSKTLNLTSDARSNGKHLVHELIGCVMNGAVIKDIQVGDNVFRAYDLMIATGLSTDDDKPVPESKTWSDDQKPTEIKYGEKNLIKRDCAHCSESVSYTKINGEVLYACPLSRCKYEAETEPNPKTGHRTFKEFSDNESTMVGISDESEEWWGKVARCHSCGSEFMVTNDDEVDYVDIKCCPVCGKRVSGTMTENGNEEIYDFRKG